MVWDTWDFFINITKWIEEKEECCDQTASGRMWRIKNNDVISAYGLKYC